MSALSLLDFKRPQGKERKCLAKRAKSCKAMGSEVRACHLSSRHLPAQAALAFFWEAEKPKLASDKAQPSSLPAALPHSSGAIPQCYPSTNPLPASSTHHLFKIISCSRARCVQLSSEREQGRVLRLEQKEQRN